MREEEKELGGHQWLTLIHLQPLILTGQVPQLGRCEALVNHHTRRLSGK